MVWHSWVLILRFQAFWLEQITRASFLTAVMGKKTLALSAISYGRVVGLA